MLHFVKLVDFKTLGVTIKHLAVLVPQKTELYKLGP